ncbi:MAG TPA: HIT domain-containing protein [Candidatus Deferrimicrobium sp.]|nr:HIT domain-containing protein [Candidatus Deferrimicrobium sp.]
MSDCPFCRIVSGDQNAVIIYEDMKTLGFLDYRPIRIGHTLVISKMHYETILDIPDADLAYLIQITKMLAGKIKIALNASGLRVSNNNYPSANQKVPHIHFHIIPVTDDTPFLVKFRRINLSESQFEAIATKIRAQL